MSRRPTDLEKYRETSAEAIARSEKLAASLEGSVKEAVDVACATETLQKEEELVKLKEGMYNAMVSSVGKQSEVAVASAMTDFEETRLVPKLATLSEKFAGLSDDLRQSLGKSAAALEETEESLLKKISEVQTATRDTSEAIEAKLVAVDKSVAEMTTQLDSKVDKARQTSAAINAKLVAVDTRMTQMATQLDNEKLQAEVVTATKAVEALETLTRRQLGRMDSDMATLLDILSDLENGSGSVMTHVTNNIKEVVDMMMMEQ